MDEEGRRKSTYNLAYWTETVNYHCDHSPLWTEGGSGLNRELDSCIVSETGSAHLRWKRSSYIY